VRFRPGLSIAIIIAITGFSCKQKGGREINEGEIHYSIDYQGDVGSFKGIMPKNLIVSFKDNKILFDISSPIGNSGIFTLTNPEKGIYDTYISLFSWRYYYAAKQGERPPGFESMEGMQIRKISKTKEICGFKCSGAEITLPADHDKVYEVWYTNEIKVDNPNISNPFKDIDGVLMAFFFFMGDAQMYFNAETVYRKEIPDKTFERRDKFQRISKAEIDKFILKLISL